MREMKWLRFYMRSVVFLMVDPLAVLEHANQLQKKVHKVQDLEVENRQLKGRLEEYNSEFAEVKNQGELISHFFSNYSIHSLNMYDVYQ